MSFFGISIFDLEISVPFVSLFKNTFHISFYPFGLFFHQNESKFQLGITKYFHAKQIFSSKFFVSCNEW